MARSGPRRARITAGLAATCLVASASALAIGGHADWSAPPRFDGAGYAVLARAWRTGQGTVPSITPIGPGTPIFHLVIPWFWP